MKHFIIGVIVTLSILGFLNYDYELDGAKRKFIKKQHVMNEIVLTVHIFKNERELKAAIEDLLPKKHSKKDILGFSVWLQPHDGTCTIYVTEAHRESDFDTWGHELAHCIYGSWHKE